MKKNILFFLLFFVSVPLQLQSMSLLLGKKQRKENIFSTHVDVKKELLKKISNELDKLLSAKESFSEEVKVKVEVIKSAISQLKQKLAVVEEDEYLSKALAEQNKCYQAVTDLQKSREQRITLLRDLKSLIKDYLKDPEQERFQDSLFSVSAVHSFSDLTVLKEQLSLLEQQHVTLSEQLIGLQEASENNKKAATILSEDFNRKKVEHQNSIVVKVEEVFGLTPEQKNELFILEEKLHRFRQQLYAEQKEERTEKKELFRIKIFVVSLRIDIVRKVFNQVKSSIRITESELFYARSEHKKAQQNINAKKQEVYDPTRESISQEITQKKLDLKDLAQDLNITINGIADWSKSSNPTVDSWLSFVKSGKLQDEIVLLEKKKELLDAEISKQEALLLHQALSIEVQDSFFKKDAGNFSQEEDSIPKEISRYKLEETKLKAQKTQLVSNEKSAKALLEQQKKALENIKIRMSELEPQKLILFKNNENDYFAAYQYLEEAENLILQQIEKLNKVVSANADSITTLNKAEELIAFIITELDSIRIIWQRSENAISWEGLSNFFPDIKQFFFDLNEKTAKKYSVFLNKILKVVINKPFLFILFIIQLLLLLGLLFLIRRIVLALKGLILESMIEIDSIAYAFRALIFIVINFIIDYFGLIALWVIIFSLLRLYVLSDPLPYILFYLASMPYLLLISNRLIAQFFYTNKKYHYLYISKNFEFRYKTIFSFLIYTSIILFFFREAFSLANYHKSELPSILTALSFITLQLSCIFFIGKEQILNMLPESSDLWVWIREKIDQYYYAMLFFMVAIIIMMNPYVGFGRLVLYILTRIIYTIVLIATFLWLHTLIKRVSAGIFFSEEPDATIKERFSNAKSWYGVFIIGSLLSILFLGAIIVSKIWLWPEALSHISTVGDIVAWLKTSILLSNTENPISIYTFLQIIFFILTGFSASFLVQRFVLVRIFDVLLVDTGIQYTVTSITQYLIMLIAIIFGLNVVGLGQQLGLITAFFGIIVVAFKDPVSDFSSYFIILVQRPVKIGDFIKVDSEVTGVVRRITPRSVVLRRKNSTMVVVPNSYLMTRPIVNWNYSRGFIAMNDIIILVDYDSDPLKAKKLLLQIADKNAFVLKVPKPVIRLDDFGDNGYKFMFRAFVSSNYTLDQWNIASDLRIQIVEVFAEEKVKLALPMRVLIHKGKNDNEQPLVEEPSKD